MTTNSVIIDFPVEAMIHAIPQPAAPDFDLTQPHTVLHLHSQRCRFCNHTAKWTKVYECTTKERGRKLEPRAIVNPDLPVLVVNVREEILPMCSHCFAMRPLPEAEAHARWAETLKRKAEQAPALTKPSGPALEDL